MRAIAIVAAGGVLPGGNDLDGLWRLIVEGKDALSEPPPGRWLLDPASIHDPSEPKPDRVLCTRGGFVPHVRLAPREGGLDAETLDALDPSVILTLKAAREAWDAARTDGIDGARVAVILGHIALPTDGMSALSRSVIGRAIETQVTGRDPGAGDVPAHAHHALGLPPLAVARDLGLSGRAFAIDAACSSSLFALALACEELRARRADAVIAGGASRPDALYTQMGFSQLRALSRKGFCTPFDARGDGLVVGEGAVAFVLKRLDDAVASRDEILGVIRGYGVSNDVEGNLLAPSSEGQVRALRAAYADARWRPDDVDLIECHATGTPVGDGVEVTSLRTLWDGSHAGGRRCVIGGAKSNVGHLLTGAGAVGVAKVLLAMRHATLPPTAHFERAPERVPLADSPFEVLRTPRTWERRAEGVPRRAGVSAFGFGGTNAHVLLEEWLGGVPQTEPAPADAPVAIVGSARVGTPTAVRAGRFRIPPTEIADMLAQQAALLDAADRALHDAGITERATDLRAGVFAGIRLDPETTDYDLRWTALARGPEWARARGVEPECDAGRAWIAAVADAVHEPLTAHRVLGALGGVAGARIAREMRFGGVTMSVGAEAGTDIVALQLARDALARGDIDVAVVGSVEIAADPRVVPGAGPEWNGASALVLRRVADAEARGEPVRALVRAPGPAGAAMEGRGLAAVATRLLRFGQNPDTLAPWVRSYDDPPRAIALHADVVLGGSVATRLEEAPRVGVVTDVPRSAPGVFVIRGRDAADVHRRLEELAACDGPCHEAAARWAGAERAHGAGGDVRVAIVARDAHDLRERIAEARAQLDGAPPRHVENARVFVSRAPLAARGELAFVFPGSGSHFMGMGRAFAEHFPDVVTGGPFGPETFAEELRPDVFWTGETPLTDDDQRPHIQAQVALGTMLSGLLKTFGLRPTAYLGYSLGETAALYASGAWKARRAMLDRVAASDLFTRQLCGPCDAARAAWGLPDDAPVAWLLGVLAAPADVVREALRGRERAYLLIVNTDEECVVGGERAEVERLVADVARPFVPLSGVTTVHCAVLEPVAAAYHALHVFDDAGPPRDGARVYSCAWGRAYDVTRTSGADSIVENARHGFDWPRVVRQAWDDGVRVFVEIGPGNSCTRTVRSILGDRPHRAVSLCVDGRDAYESVLRVLAAVAVEGFDVDLDRLYGHAAPAEDMRPIVATVTPGMKPFVLPRVPVAAPTVAASTVAAPRANVPATTVPSPSVAVATPPALVEALAHAAAARAAAHEAFVRFADRSARLVAAGVATQHALLAGAAADASDVATAVDSVAPQRAAPAHDAAHDAAPPPAFDRAQSLEFARGRIGAVLGPRWAEVDALPSRVRLPDEPYNFVDRIVAVEGEPLSMTHGRVVTEHDVPHGAWYLDHGCIPAGLCIEAGQADLFLSAWLGADFETRGRAVYRLLDAAVVFHARLPRPGDTIRFDIRIERFFRQGRTLLFRFAFEGSVDGVPVLSMRDGCAGFFSEEELAAGQGVVLTARDREPRAGVLPADWRALVPFTRTTLDAVRVDALRRGDLVAAFGADFEGLALASPSRLPGAELALVHRVTDLDPAGGRFGIGLVRTEIDVHADDWFLTCHFVDDMVMPGTLMYECALQALRVFLARSGVVGEHDALAYEPVPGVASRLRCRGQVVAGTRVSAYEVHVKESGFRPEPYALADCLMYADGRAVVHILDMSLRVTGTSRDALERLWAGRSAAAPLPFLSKAGILAHADGRPSDALGPRFAPFDAGRFLARLPRPPYQFLDRVESVSRPPFEMREGLEAVVVWDVPARGDGGAWVFDESGGGPLPFAALLEVALQACGWCAAYMGSALTSDAELRFRNLGGSATLARAVHPGAGPAGGGALRTHVRVTGVSASAGMILQHYAFAVHDDAGLVYEGTTYFGFFTAASLAAQVGLRDTALRGGAGETFRAPDAAPFARDRWRMLDVIEAYDATGGEHGLGYVRGAIDVEPSAWFFRAHFRDDPVWPGSLGLESLVQALEVHAARAFELGPGDVFLATAPGVAHEWTYRGQVLPSASRVTVELQVTACDAATRTVCADGLLACDGKPIYAVRGLSVQVTAAP